MTFERLPILEIVPMTLTDARVWVDRVHRTHRAPRFGLFAIGLARDGDVVGAAIVGAAIVGRPVARLNEDGWTAEVTRVAVMDGIPKVATAGIRAAIAKAAGGQQ